MAVTFATAGFTIPRLLPFAEALLSALFSVFLALSIAIFLIEGPSMTRLGRRSRIIERTSKAIIADAAEKNSWSTLGLGRWLGSILPQPINVDEEINNIQDPNWESSVNPVLRKVFRRAEDVVAADIKSADAIPVHEYEETVAGTRDFVSDVRRRLESNLDVHERLLELSEAIEKLDQVITQCWYPINIREEENRFRSLGQLGIASIDFHESLNRIHRRLKKKSLGSNDHPHLNHPQS